MAIFQFFKKAAVRRLQFLEIKILTVNTLRGTICVTMPKFRADRSKSNRNWGDNGYFQIFSKWRPSAILDLLYTYFDNQRRVFGALCYNAKFGWNQWSRPSFDNMEVLIFCVLGFKMPIHALKYTHNMGSSINAISKRYFLARAHGAPGA